MQLRYLVKKKSKEEIFDELSREPARIPWMKEVEKVTVTEI